MRKSLAVTLAIMFSTSSLTMFISPAEAKPKSLIPKVGTFTKKQEDGYAACISWCDAHNQTANSRAVCHEQCVTYWSGHQG